MPRDRRRGAANPRELRIAGGRESKPFHGFDWAASTPFLHDS